MGVKNYNSCRVKEFKSADNYGKKTFNIARAVNAETALTYHILKCNYSQSEGSGCSFQPHFGYSSLLLLYRKVHIMLTSFSSVCLWPVQSVVPALAYRDRLPTPPPPSQQLQLRIISSLQKLDGNQSWIWKDGAVIDQPLITVGLVCAFK